MTSPASQLTPSEMGTRSWDKRNSAKEIARLKSISKKGVAARKKNRATKKKWDAMVHEALLDKLTRSTRRAKRG